MARLALPLLLLIAVANFAWQLGSSSYFVDEAESIHVVARPLGDVLHAVGQIEIAPPLYFFFLHGWLTLLGWPGTEWTARLPSVISGVLLVATVYWLASRVSERRTTALAAAALTALSPFVLEFAQRAQPYMALSLASTLAVTTAVEADRQRSTRWLAGSLVASLVALELHYTAVLAIAPLCVWLATRGWCSRRAVALFAGACVACELLLIPLLLTQHNSFPNRQGTLGARVNWDTVASMLDLPFSGRVEALRLLGVAVVVSLAVYLLARRRFSAPARLVVAVAVGTPALLFLLTALGGDRFWGHLMITRYAAVAAPLLIVALALALDRLPARAAIVALAAALAVSAAGLIESHRDSGFYVDARGAVHYLRGRVSAGDTIVAPSDPVAELPLGFYGLGDLSASVVFEPTDAAPAIVGHARVWAIVELRGDHAPTAAGLLSTTRHAVARFGYTARSAVVFAGLPPLAIELLVPRA